MDTPQRTETLPKIMTRSDFLDLRTLLAYHHASDEVDACLKTLWK